MEPKRISITLDDTIAQEFVQFWNKERDAGRLDERFGRAHLEGARPGNDVLALPLPPEVVIAFFGGIAHVTGEAVGKIIWRKLREFMKTRVPQLPPSRLITLNLGASAEATVRVRASDLDNTDAPLALLGLDHDDR